MSAADTSNERVRVFVQADDGRAFVAVSDRLDAMTGETIDFADVPQSQQLALRLVALSDLSANDLQGVVDTLANHSDVAEWRAIARVLRASVALLPGVGALVERASTARAKRLCAERNTDELEALAKAALDELRNRGRALSMEVEQDQHATALRAVERLAASARAVEQIARAAPANEGGR